MARRRRAGAGPGDPADGGRLLESYRAAGAEVSATLRPGGHGVGPEEIDALADWLGTS